MSDGIYCPARLRIISEPLCEDTQIEMPSVCIGCEHAGKDHE